MSVYLEGVLPAKLVRNAIFKITYSVLGKYLAFLPICWYTAFLLNIKIVVYTMIICAGNI